MIGETAFAEQADQISYYVWFNACIKQFLVILVAYLIFKGFKAKKINVEKPEAFNPVQKKQLWLLILALVAMIVPTILNTWISSPVLAKIAALTQPQSVMVIAAILSVLLNLGSEKDVIRKIPMNTIILIAGMYMLLSVAKDAGMTDTIANIISNISRHSCTGSAGWICSIPELLLQWNRCCVPTALSNGGRFVNSIRTESGYVILLCICRCDEFFRFSVLNRRCHDNCRLPG